MYFINKHTQHPAAVRYFKVGQLVPEAPDSPVENLFQCVHSWAEFQSPK